MAEPRQRQGTAYEPTTLNHQHQFIASARTCLTCGRTRWQIIKDWLVRLP